MYVGLHVLVQYRYSSPILKNFEFDGEIFENSSNIKFH